MSIDRSPFSRLYFFDVPMSLPASTFIHANHHCPFLHSRACKHTSSLPFARAGREQLRERRARAGRDGEAGRRGRAAAMAARRAAEGSAPGEAPERRVRRPRECVSSHFHVYILTSMYS